MARTAPVPNIPAPPGMNPGAFVAGGGGNAGGKGGKGKKKGKGKKSAKGKKKDKKGGTDGNCAGGGGSKKCPGNHGGKGKKKGRGDPVDVSTGRVFTEPAEDLFLDGALPLEWARSYSSSNTDRDVGLGYGWSHSFSAEIEVLRRQVMYWSEDGSLTEFSRIDVGAVEQGEDGLLLRREAWGYIVSDAWDTHLVFAEAVDQGRRYLLTAVQDRNAHRITLEYASGQLARLVDSAGRVVQVARDAHGRINRLSVVADGRTLPMRSYEYTSDGDLARTWDVDGFTESFRYERHLLTRFSDSTGLTYHYRYDREDRCFESWGDYGPDPIPGLESSVPALLADGVTPAKGINHVCIEFFDDWTEVIDSVLVQRYATNDDGLIEQAVSDGAVFSRDFDEEGNETRLTYPSGAVEEWAYDARGDVIEYRDLKQGVTRYGRDAKGRPVHVEWPSGAVYDYRYDPAGNLVEIGSPIGVWRFQYRNGFLVQRVDPDGSVWQGTWNDQGLLSGVRGPMGEQWSAEYDPLGRMTSHKDPSGATTRYEYSPGGTLLRETYGDGSWEAYQLDGARQLHSVSSSDGRTLRMRPGVHREAAESLMPDGRCIKFYYDRENRLSRVENAAGENHELEYDASGFLIRETAFSGVTRRYRYGLEGQPVQFEDGGGGIVEQEYSPDGELILRSGPDGDLTIEYDADGDARRWVNGHSEVELVRDVMGRVVEERCTVDGETFVVNVTWGANDAPRVLSTSFGHTREFDHDKSGNLTRLALDGSSVLKFACEARGLPTRVEFPRGGWLELGWDALERPNRVTLLQSVVQGAEPELIGVRPGLVSETLIEYGAQGEPTAAHDTRLGTHEYVYDAALRLAEIRGAAHERYQFDAASNRFAVGSQRRYVRGGVLESDGGERYSWDAAGRLARRHTTQGDWEYTWNHDGELVGVTRPDGASIEFAYDGLGRLLTKRVLTAAETGSRITKHVSFFWAGDALVHVRTRTEQGEELETYAHAENDFIPVAHRRGGEWRFVVPGGEALGLRLVDEAGSHLEDVVLDAYGRALRGGDDFPVRFAGQCWDEDVRLSYNRARWYDPATGQYISPDPLGLDAGLLAYAYANQAPTLYSDPLGLDKASRTCLYDSKGKRIADGYSGRGPKPWSKAGYKKHEPIVEDALKGPKTSYGKGKKPHVHKPGDCGEPDAFSNLTQGASGPAQAQERLDSVAKVVIIQCRPNKGGKPKVGEHKPPCKYCQKTLANLKSGKGTMADKVSKDKKLQKDCLKSGSGCKK